VKRLDIRFGMPSITSKTHIKRGSAGQARVIHRVIKIVIMPAAGVHRRSDNPDTRALCMLCFNICMYIMHIISYYYLSTAVFMLYYYRCEATDTEKTER